MRATTGRFRSLIQVGRLVRTLGGAAVLEAIAGWRKAGKIERMTTMRMTSLENEKASVQIGESVPVVVGRTINAGRGGGGGQFAGGVTQMTQMEQFGTLVECTGRITVGDVIELHVSAEQTRPGRASAASPPSRTPEAAGAAIEPAAAQEAQNPSRTITQAKTVVSGKSGECKVIGASWSEGAADGVTATLVLLVPRIVTARAK